VTSDSNITLQLKCEKQLNIETSKTTIQKKPHIPIPQNSGDWHFMGALTLSFLFFEGAIFIGPSPIFLEHWALPNRSTSLDRHMG
jgi:hypothetical protein